LAAEPGFAGGGELTALPHMPPAGFKGAASRQGRRAGKGQKGERE